MSATCSNCAHYNIEAFRLSNGKLRIVKSKVARCLFSMDRLVRKFPHSAHPSDSVFDLKFMQPGDGIGCPQWTKRKVGP